MTNRIIDAMIEKIVCCSPEQQTNGIIGLFVLFIGFLGITMLIEMR